MRTSYQIKHLDEQAHTQLPTKGTYLWHYQAAKYKMQGFEGKSKF